MLLQALSLCALTALVSADCFSHDGIKALDSEYYSGAELVPCSSSNANCCIAGDKCGTNLLCVDGGGTVSRQYCANAAWIGCSDMCPGNDAAGVSIHDCGGNIYCCGVDTEEACCTDERAFYVDPDDGGVTQTTVAAKTKAPRWFMAETSSTLASSSASSTLSSSSDTSAASTSAPSSASTATTTSSATPTPTETSNSSSRISTGAGAGIGVGAAAGIILVVGALVWLLLQRKKQNDSQGAANAVSGQAVDKIMPPLTYYAHYASEVDGTHRRELDGGLPPSMRRQELGGTVG